MQGLSMDVYNSGLPVPYGVIRWFYGGLGYFIAKFTKLLLLYCVIYVTYLIYDVQSRKDKLNHGIWTPNISFQVSVKMAAKIKESETAHKTVPGFGLAAQTGNIQASSHILHLLNPQTIGRER